MKKNEIESIFEEVFGFLTTDYNFQVISSKKTDWGYMFEAVNSTTGIEIRYEFREAYIQISLYRLIDGKIVKNTKRAIKNNEQIAGFGLGLVIESKNQEAIVKPAYEYGIESPFYEEKNGLRNYAIVFSDRLKEYASDILSGDFSSFVALDSLVKSRYYSM